MRRKPRNPAAELAKLRWLKTGDSPAEVGRLGGIAAKGKSGRKPATDRCPCGDMTAERAAKRGHKCEGSKPTD